MDDAELLKDLRGLGKPPLFENDTAKTANSEVQESIKGLNDKHSKFEIQQGNVTDTPKCAISTIGSRRTDRSQNYWRRQE